MKKNTSDHSGVLELLKQYKSIFHTSENTEYYSEDDYAIAERKFLIWCLETRPVFSKPHIGEII
jgi:N-acetylglutamate synthase-like GNAT family acetyltransferase